MIQNVHYECTLWMKIKKLIGGNLKVWVNSVWESIALFLYFFLMLFQNRCQTLEDALAIAHVCYDCGERETPFSILASHYPDCLWWESGLEYWWNWTVIEVRKIHQHHHPDRDENLWYRGQARRPGLSQWLPWQHSPDNRCQISLNLNNIVAYHTTFLSHFWLCMLLGSLLTTYCGEG